MIRIVEHKQLGLPGHTLSHALDGYALTIRYDGQEHVVDLSDVPSEGLPPGGPALPAAAFLGAEWEGEDLVVHVVRWEEEGVDFIPGDLPETEQ
jgi:hypothetical protein